MAGAAGMHSRLCVLSAWLCNSICACSTALPASGSCEAIHLFTPAPSAGNFCQGLIATRGSCYSFYSPSAGHPRLHTSEASCWWTHPSMLTRWLQSETPTAVTVTALARSGLGWKQPWATCCSLCLRKPKVKHREDFSLQDTEGHVCFGHCLAPSGLCEGALPDATQSTSTWLLLWTDTRRRLFLPVGSRVLCGGPAHKPHSGSSSLEKMRQEQERMESKKIRWVWKEEMIRTRMNIRPSGLQIVKDIENINKE